VIVEDIFPNPAHSTVTISYSLTHQAIVSLSVYDLHGKPVRCFVDEPQQAGRHTITWNAESLKPGVYFYRIRTGKDDISCKFIIW
jgi:hypothetical protein